jgi:hypothetical protein
MGEWERSFVTAGHWAVREKLYALTWTLEWLASGSKFFTREKIPQYPPDKQLNGHQSWPGCGGEENCSSSYLLKYSKTCPRRNRKGPNIFSKLGNFPHYTKLQKK